MKENLIISLSEISDVDEQQSNAVKKSIEFFMGRMIDIEEIHSLREKEDSCIDCVSTYLSKQGMCIREGAIFKKYNEFYKGKFLDGTIKSVSLNVNLKKLCEENNVTLISTLPEDETEFLVERLKICCDLICDEEFSCALEKAKKSGCKYLGCEDKKETVEEIGIKFEKIKN